MLPNDVPDHLPDDLDAPDEPLPPDMEMGLELMLATGVVDEFKQDEIRAKFKAAWRKQCKLRRQQPEPQAELREVRCPPHVQLQIIRGELLRVLTPKLIEARLFRATLGHDAGGGPPPLAPLLEQLFAESVQLANWQRTGDPSHLDGLTL